MCAKGKASLDAMAVAPKPFQSHLNQQSEDVFHQWSLELVWFLTSSIENQVDLAGETNGGE